MNDKDIILSGDKLTLDEIVKYCDYGKWRSVIIRMHESSIRSTSLRLVGNGTVMINSGKGVLELELEKIISIQVLK